MTRPPLAAFAVLLLAGCSRSSTQKGAEAAAPLKGAEPFAVQVVKAEARQVERTISVTGSLHPDDSVSVAFEVPGRVSKIYVDFGQAVRQGQVIAELDNQEYALQVERSRASLTQALARLGLDPGQANVTPESTPAMRQAQAQLEDARSRYDSAARLIQSGDISQERFTEMEKAYRARQAAYDAARDEMRTQAASVQAIQAELRLAQKRLADTVVRAPFDGSITARQASPGQYMKENTPLVTLVKTHPLRLRVEIPESATGEAQVGRSLTFTTDAAAGAEFHAVVRELSPALDARSRSLTVEARLVEADTRLRPGMFVQVRLVVERNATVVVVPNEAVYTVAGLTKVFVVRGEKALERRVPPGIVRDGWVEVPADQVEAGDLVAVSSLGTLTDGAPVRPAAAPAGKS